MTDTATTSRYIAVSDPYKDWTLRECEDYSPTERQCTIIEAVQSALDAKLFYTSDVLEHCKVFLGVTPDQAAVGAKNVEGGDVGMDCYYARGYLEAQRCHKIARISLDRLKPRVGQCLGTLVFNDFKRTTGVTVTEYSGGKILHASGKRGAYTVTLSCTAIQIENAINRAFERKQRKDNFDSFVAAVPAPKPASPAGLTTRPVYFVDDFIIAVELPNSFVGPLE